MKRKHMVYAAGALLVLLGVAAVAIGAIRCRPVQVTLPEDAEIFETIAYVEAMDADIYAGLSFTYEPRESIHVYLAVPACRLPRETHPLVAGWHAVRYSQKQLRDLQAAFRPYGGQFGIHTTSVSVTENILEVGIENPDEALIRQIALVFPETDMYRVVHSMPNVLF